MFGNVLYFNDKKIKDYSSLITKKPIENVQSVKSSKELGFNLKASVIEGGAKSTKSFESNVITNLLYECEVFENLLKGREDYFDFCSNYKDFQIETMNRGSIVKFESTVSIPVEFDILQLIEQMKPALINAVLKESQEDDAEIVRNLLKMQEMKIPIVCNIEEIIASGKLDSRNLCCEYIDLEDIENEECVIIARLSSTGLTNKNNEIYEPLKDLLVFNRELRRNFSDERPKELDKIFSKDNYIKLEILAIYQ